MHGLRRNTLSFLDVLAVRCIRAGAGAAALAFNLLLVYAFLAPTRSVVAGVVREKELRLREGMRILGLKVARILGPSLPAPSHSASPGSGWSRFQRSCQLGRGTKTSFKGHEDEPEGHNDGA